MTTLEFEFKPGKSSLWACAVQIWPKNIPERLLRPTHYNVSQFSPLSTVLSTVSCFLSVLHYLL